MPSTPATIAVAPIGQRRARAIRAGGAGGRLVAVRALASGSRRASAAREGLPSQRPMASASSHQAAAIASVLSSPPSPTAKAAIAPRAVASPAVRKTETRSRSEYGTGLARQLLEY